MLQTLRPGMTLRMVQAAHPPPASGAGGGLDVTREEPGDGDGPLSRLVIYFDFDRSEIRSDFSDMLRAHGAFLADNADRQVRLEGQRRRAWQPGIQYRVGRTASPGRQGVYSCCRVLPGINWAR